jgi:tripartite motif-containing protein 2/3
MGRIIVVECKVMRVFIFDTNGNVLNKFTCSKYLEFPNGVCCNDKQEIFISDNRAHCIKVFSYDGQFVRTIGSEGITNYPIGVVQNSQGDVLIADNHNNFNLTIFTQDGQLINALESKVKHAQCFDVALTDDGSVVLASKDYRIYVYRYLMTPSLMGSGGGVNGNNTGSSSPSTTPNSSQMMNGECTSPSFINGHGESPPITSNGY